MSEDREDDGSLEYGRFPRLIGDISAYQLPTGTFTIREPKPLGNWQCHLFGSHGEGITWRPCENQVPNWFWRKMQYLAFGNRWVKDK